MQANGASLHGASRSVQMKCAEEPISLLYDPIILSVPIQTIYCIIVFMLLGVCYHKQSGSVGATFELMRDH